MSGVVLDFLVYLGDPDDAGTEAIPSGEAVAKAEVHKDVLKFPDVYGAIIATKDGKELCPRRPDPIFSLVTNMVRAVPYVIEGEAETMLLSESEHGLSFEPSGDDVHVSYFAGDAYEPDEFLLQPTLMSIEDFGGQVLSMGERLEALIQKLDPSLFESDDYMKSLREFLEVGREAYKTFQLEVERGLRVQ